MEHDDELVVELLREIHPHECDFIGEAAVREIAAGPVEVVRAEHGSNLDLTQIILVVAATAGLIRLALDLHDRLGRLHARRVTAAELEAAAAAERGADVLGLAPELRAKVFRHLEERDRPGSPPGRRTS